MWKKEWLDHQRAICGNDGLMEELCVADKANFSLFVRMDSVAFDHLLEMVTPDIFTQDTVMRVAIPVRSKLIVTLRYLATGETFTSLAYQSRIAKQSICVFVPLVLRAIYDRLKGSVLKVSF